jgi:hypothetical protein
MALVLKGQIVPLDAADPDAVFDGRVFIDDQGTIEAVTRGTAPARSHVTPLAVNRLSRPVRRVAGRRKGESAVSDIGDYVDIGRLWFLSSLPKSGPNSP